MTPQLHEFLSQHFTIRVNEKGEEVEFPQPYTDGRSNADLQAREFEYYKCKRVIKLPTLSDFIQYTRQNSDSSPFECEQKEIDTKDLYLIYQYENWLRTPLTLSMFVPWEEGEVLEEPKEYQHYLKDGRGIVDPELYKCGVYQRAQSNVMFEGWKVFGVSKLFPDLIKIKSTGVYVNYSEGIFSLATGAHEELKTISDLIPLGLKLRV